MHNDKRVKNKKLSITMLICSFQSRAPVPNMCCLRHLSYQVVSHLLSQVCDSGFLLIYLLLKGIAEYSSSTTSLNNTYVQSNSDPALSTTSP